MNHINSVAAAHRRWTFATLAAAVWLTACDDRQPPAFCAVVPDQTVLAGETTTVKACFDDPDDDVLTYAVASSEPDVATATVSATTVTLAGVAPGTAVVTVSATDATGLEGKQDFLVVVPNRAPEVVGDIAALELVSGDSATVGVLAHFTDPDGEDMEFTAASSDGDVVTATVSGAEVEVRAQARGLAVVTVTAVDPGGLTGSLQFGVTVSNEAPVATRPIDSLNMLPGRGTWLIQGYKHFSDPDGHDLEYSSTTSDAQVATTSVDGNLVHVRGVAEGKATVTVTARDPGGLTAELPWVLTVGNKPPVVKGQPPDLISSRAEMDSLPFSRYLGDADAGDELKYLSSSDKPGVATVTTKLNYTLGFFTEITGVSPGEATVTMTVRDLAGLEARVSFLVTVAANHPPRITKAIPSQYIADGDTVTLVLSDYFEDPDGDTLTFTAQTSAQADYSLSGDTLRLWTTKVGGIGFVRVTARDPSDRTASQRAPVLKKSS